MTAANDDEDAVGPSASTDVDGDKYRNKGRDMIEAEALHDFEYHSALPAKKAEDFARQKAKSDSRFREEAFRPSKRIRKA
jgi:hypothetical protein